MTNEKIVERIKSGEDKQKNMERLYLKNKGMISKIAYRYKGLADFDDLCQEGFIGLMLSADLWTPDGGSSFASYAFKWIRAQMRRYIDNNGSMIRIPTNQKSRVLRYHKIIDSFRMSFNRLPTSKEISAILQITQKEIEEIKRDALILSTRSLDELIGEEDSVSLGDQIADERDRISEILDDVQREEMSDLLWSIVNDLPEKDSKIIKWRYQDGLTLSECGDRLGISSEGIRRHEQKAIKYLRKVETMDRLRPYVDDREEASAYQATGLQIFKRTWTSSPERTIIQKEEIRERSAMMSV